MERYRQQAALLKAIGHPVRLQIVDLLRIEPECVCHISAALNKPQPYVSQQLAILRNARVIIDERDGTNIYYRLADENVARQVAAACEDCPPSNGNGAGAARRPLACCTCPKCSVARDHGVEAYELAC
jgi:DNA-binding transcriptional ArsR family regulator